MLKPVLSVLIAAMASQATALSCVFPDPVRTFQAASAAPETYVILRGTLSEAEILIPPDRTRSYPVPVWFTGHALTQSGFTRALEQEMTVQVTCAGEWCGGVPPETDTIFFAQVQDGAYVISSDPCNFWMFPPDPLTVEVLTSCLRGAACVPADQVD